MFNRPITIGVHRMSILAIALGVAVIISACSAASGDEGNAAALTSVSGAVTGYNATGTSSVQAFAPSSAVQLVSGLVYPAPNSRVEGSLTSLENIPEYAMVNPYFYNNVTSSPATLLTTGVIGLGVADSQGVTGALVRTTMSDADDVVNVGGTFHYYFVASMAGSIRGTCADQGVTYAYDIDLVKGWNHMVARVTAIDSSGIAVAVTYADGTPPSSARWIYVDINDVSSLASKPTSLDQVLSVIERGLTVPR